MAVEGPGVIPPMSVAPREAEAEFARASAFRSKCETAVPLSYGGMRMVREEAGEWAWKRSEIGERLTAAGSASRGPVFKVRNALLAARTRVIRSGDPVVDDVPPHVGQPEIAALKAISQVEVVQAE